MQVQLDSNKHWQQKSMFRNTESDRLSIHILVSLLNRAADERRRQMVWDKRDNNYDWKKKKKSAKLHFQLRHTDLFVED